MKNLIATSALAAVLALAAPNTAKAADGAICYSDVLTQTGTAGFGTTNFPQLENNTKFACANPNFKYTIRELSQGGWIIDNLGPVGLSTTTSPDGTVIVRSRWMLTIQK